MPPCLGFLALGGVALATGLLNGSPGLLLGLVPAVAAALAIALALAARQLAGALAWRSMRAWLAAGASAVGDGVDEALRLRNEPPRVRPSGVDPGMGLTVL